MELDLTDDDIKLFKMCKKRWGEDYQINKLIEELNEAAAVLARFKNNEAHYYEINEELADVLVMIAQYSWMNNQGEFIYDYIKKKQKKVWKLLKLTPEKVTLTDSDLIGRDKNG